MVTRPGKLTGDLLGYGGTYWINYIDICWWDINYLWYLNYVEIAGKLFITGIYLICWYLNYIAGMIGMLEYYPAW